MIEQQRHEMILEVTHPSGAEEWYCPTCGRRFMLNWPPVYRKIILDPGNELAIHSGGKGGLNMSQVDIDPRDEPELPPRIRSSIEKILRDFDGDLDESGSEQSS
jgi:hypothetical protein